jgi:hypothetical protein
MGWRAARCSPPPEHQPSSSRTTWYLVVTREETVWLNGGARTRRDKHHNLHMHMHMQHMQRMPPHRTHASMRAHKTHPRMRLQQIPAHAAELIGAHKTHAGGADRMRVEQIGCGGRWGFRPPSTPTFVLEAAPHTIPYHHLHHIPSAYTTYARVLNQRAVRR